MSKIPSLLLSIILIGNVILIAETVRPENDPPELPVEILYPGTFESDGSELTEPDTVDVEGPGNSRYAAGGRGAIYDHGELGGSWHNELIDRVGIEYLNDTEVSGGRAGLRLWDIKPDGDCAGLWHLDDGTGANAADSSNNGNDGTVNGGLWSPGRFRTGLHLNGEGDGVTVRSSASLNITGELSLEGWVNGSELSRCDSVISKSTYSLGTNSEGRATFEVLEGHEALGRPGDIGHFAYCMVPFDGKLWAGTDDGGKVYCWDGSGQWVEVGKPHDTDKVFSMASYNGKLYAGSGKRPKVYRYDGGTTWTEVGQLDDCDHVISLAVYRGDLYAGTEGYASVYRYEGNGNWVRSDQLGDDENDEAYSLAVFGDKLFCGTRSPGVVWSFDGQTWVNSGQISDNNVETLTVYDGELYAGTYPDGDVHRYLGGDQWTSVGKPTGEDASVSLAVYAGRLYCGTYPNHGLYRYDGGQSWTEITSLSGVKFDSLAAFDGKLYAAGTDGDVVTVGDGLELLSSSTVDTGNFTHLAATYNGTTAVLYVDGEYDSSVNRSVTLGTSARHLSLGGSGDSRFGGRSGSGEDHLRGTLDDFAVWDRALSASEVRSRQRLFAEAGNITSKSITRPRGMNWTRLTLSCETPPGTELRFTLVNASSNETIPGFADMDAREVDISGVPDGEIRLRAHLSGGGDLTPFLDSWSVEWKRADAWWDGFAGNGSLAGSEDIIYHNASAMPRYRELTGRNITASWNMAETEGFLVGDSSGKGLHGVLRNMEEGDWKEGIMDGALDFDGADEYVDLGAAHRLDIGVDDFTLEAWVNTTDAGPVSVIFSKGNANQEGYIWGLSGGKMSLWALTENGWAQYTGTGAYGDGRWHHLVLTREGTALRMYGDGTLDVGKTLSGWEILGSSDWNARIGGVAGQDWNYSGLVDRLTVYHRALSANEVEKSSFAFSENASLRSKSVLVRANNTWDAFRFSRTVPPGTWLNVTIFEGDTGEVIWWDNGTAPEGTADMSFLNVLETSLLFFGARLHSDGPSAPALLSWGINWTPYEQPRLISDLPNITLLEDTPALDILDISNHFRDVYGFISSPSYNRSQPSDGKNISLALDGSMVSVIRLADNWTGMVVVNFSCTNLYGLRALSNDVIIRVRGSNDVPCWKAAPPSVEFDEDGNETTDWSLDDYAFDIEGDELAFGVQAEDDNISASVDGDGRISVEAERDYHGNSQMSVWAYEIHNQTSRTRNFTVELIVNSVNDPPQTVLLLPEDGAVIGDPTVELDWEAHDVDHSPEELRYDLYLGSHGEPALYCSDITGTNFSLDSLESGIEYRWYVLPRDPENTGGCLNGTRRFSVDLDVSVPEVRLLSPPDGFVLRGTEMNVTWELLPWNGTEPVFSVYVGTSPDGLKKYGSTMENRYHITGLDDNTTYYWKVVPVAGSLQGRCANGTWHFSVDLSVERRYDLRCELELNNLTLRPGGEHVFNATLENAGNVPCSIRVSAEGLLSGFLGYRNEVELGQGEVAKIRFRLNLSPHIVAGDYVIVIRVEHEEGNFSFPVRVILITNGGSLIPEDDDDTPEGGGSSGTGTGETKSTLSLALMAAAAVLGLLIVLFLILLLKKRRGKIHRRTGTGRVPGPAVPRTAAGSRKTEVRGKSSPMDASPSSFSGGVEEVASGESPGMTTTPGRGVGIKSRGAGEGDGASIPLNGKMSGAAPPATPPAPPIGGGRMPPEGTEGSGAAGTIAPEEGAEPSFARPPAPAPGGTPAGTVRRTHGPKVLGDEKGFELTDVFLVYVDGRLVRSAHFLAEEGPGLDDEAMGNLLGAITDFISDSFTEEKGALKALQHGKKNIYLERGVGMYLAVVFLGEPLPELRERMRHLLIRLWERYKYKLKVWNGTTEGLEGLDDMLRAILDKGSSGEEADEQEPAHIGEEMSPSRGKVVAAIASESAMCGICMGVIKTGLVFLTCPCGKRYHKACGDRMGECPVCGLDLSFERAIMVGDMPEPELPGPNQEQGFLPSGEMLPPPDEQEDDGQKPEQAEIKGPMAEEFRIDI